MFKNIHPSWKDFLMREKATSYFQELIENVKQAYQNNVCYPEVSNILRLLKLVGVDEIKVVILGQDPYHQPQQANGLAFSVSKEVVIPPSLKNIFLELKSDLQITNTHGDLTKWAAQGVFLLNTVLTVERAKPLSHSHFKWHFFTDNLIKYISVNTNNTVFILWGKKAQSKVDLIDQEKHLIITGAHPSPLGAHYGFFNKNYFSQTNQFLKKHEKNLIDWQL